MEEMMKKVSGLVILFVFTIIMATAQKKDQAYYQCAFFESYRLGNLESWTGWIAEMENVKSVDLEWQIEMLNAMYGLVGYQIGAGKKDLARVYVNKAADYLDVLLDEYPKNARLHSLAGALYGYKIALAFYKAPFLGPKSMYHIGKSIDLDPSEPMGYIEKGNSLLYRPAAFGVDKKETLINYRKALKLMDTRNSQKCDWQKMLLRAFILKGLYETNQTSEAKVFFAEMQKDYGPMVWIKQFVGANLMDGK